MDASGVEKTSESTPLNYSTCCSTTSQLQLRLHLPSLLAGARCTADGFAQYLALSSYSRCIRPGVLLSPSDERSNERCLVRAGMRPSCRPSLRLRIRTGNTDELAYRTPQAHHPRAALQASVAQ